ncbi:unnamed protein product [Linum tenue]|uniref:Uncharacterized protein n=1 Tax=Linum tenue TaxID=586396 RepID=A0AAV0QW50_9ROSI|nr:unnamed protein product [Linum tenue]
MLSTPSHHHLLFSSSSSRKGNGYIVRSNFGNNPTARVEGFDCLDKDNKNRSIPALHRQRSFIS